MSNFIPPTPQREFGLFSAATPVDPTSPEIGWGPDMGWSISSALPVGQVACCSDTIEIDPSAPSTYNFYSFEIEQLAGCLAGTSRTPRALDEQQSDADTWLAVNTEGWVEHALETGVCSGPSLFSDTTDLAAAVASVEIAASKMLRRRRLLNLYDQPTLIVPQWLSPRVDTTSGVFRNLKVVFGAGIGIDAAVAIDTDSAWVYLVGEVQYSLGSPVPGQADSAKERRQNMTWDLAARMGIFRWDPKATFKVRVDYT